MSCESSEKSELRPGSSEAVAPEGADNPADSALGDGPSGPALADTPAGSTSVVEGPAESALVDGPAGAASCPIDGVFRGSVAIWDQQGLNTLQGCQRITGNLALTVFPGMDERPLASLRDIEGGLWIYPSLEGLVPNALDGFRALEEAREILLNRLNLTSLEPLARLRRIGVGTSGPEFARSGALWQGAAVSPPDIAPGLTLLACPEISSFAGLGALEEADGIELSSDPDFVSVAGLPRLTHLPQLRVLASPLRDLEGIESLGVQDLYIYASALRSLQGLGDAQALRRLTLRENAELESLQGGTFPPSMDSLEFVQNPRLARTAGLEGLREVGTLIFRNARVPFALESLSGLSGLERATELRVLKQGNLASLAGLESLREVQTLELSQNSALTDVRSLAGLQRVGDFLLSGSNEVTRLPAFGSASVDRMQLSGLGISDLSGLEQVRIATSFVVGGMGALSSLQGLPQLAPDAEVGLSSLGLLGSVEALQGVTALGALSLTSTAVTDLDALRDLRQLGSLQLRGNAQLLQVDALREVSGLRTLEVYDHPVLRTLPTFANVTGESCETCAPFRLELSNNPALETGAGLPLLESAEDISIVGNDALSQLTGLGSLRSVASLRIAYNRALTDLDLGSLQQAVQVGIYGNASLQDAPLQRLTQVAAQQALILSNASGPALLDPCPWPEDFVCDETAGVCAAGTDLDCR